LPIFFRAWLDISINYITLLIECKRNSRTFKYILIIICYLTKMCYFIPITSLGVNKLAFAFISYIYYLYGTLNNVILN
ncbi:hypothetical protein BU23DRAFT_467491, partial [Bimuria novae-zelandiae CBS 107.79]